MKCIHCGVDSRRKERLSGQCWMCGKPFTFEPSQRPEQPTDGAFQAALARVSSQGKVHFTVDNLRYELRRSRRPPDSRLWVLGLMIAVCSLVLLGMLLLAALYQPVLWVVLGPGILVSLLYRQTNPDLIPLPEDRVAEWLARWKTVHGLPPGLIEPRALLPAHGSESLAALRAELEQYSFDRAVICDRRDTVDLLLANNFHFENNCAVLSVDGYPQSVFDIILRMLKNNPKLHIFALHDATMAGCALAYKLAHDPAWFAGQGPIFDVGLRPAHAQASAFKGLWQEAHPSARSEPCPPGVSKKEYAWLRRYQLSLAAIRPEQVIKRLFRALCARQGGDTHMTQRPPPATDSALVAPSGAPLVSHLDTILFSTDATHSDGGGDSFG